MLKISIVSAYHNRKEPLRKTLRTMEQSTYKDFEYIIVDDGSTDNTKNIIISFNDKRIKYFYYGENKGYFNLHNVVNFGLSKCSGKYIARLDADDICYPNRLKVQYDYLEKHKDIFMIGGSAIIIDEFGSHIGKIKKWNYPSILYKYHMAVSNSFVHSSIMFRNKGFLYPSFNEHMFYCWLTYFGKRLKNLP